MKLSARTDIDAPPGAVFAKLSDFARWEAAAREKGVTVTRLDEGGPPANARWRIAFDYRGRTRNTEARVVDFDQDQQIAIKGQSDGIAALVKMELTQTAPGRTWLHCTIDLTPETIKARLLLHSLKLARATIERRMGKRLEKFARHVERG